MRPCSDTEIPLGGDRAPSTATVVFRHDLELPVCVESSADFTGFSRLVQKRSVGIRNGGANCLKIIKRFPEQVGEVCKPALFSGCFQRQSVNKSANMYFHSQSSCKILVCCLKFKQDVRCITKLDYAEGCVSTYPERPDCSAGTTSQKSLELLRIFSKSNLTRCHNDL